METLWAEKLTAVLVCLGWLAQGDGNLLSDSPLCLSFLFCPQRPCPSPNFSPYVFILCCLAEDEDATSDQGNSPNMKKASLIRGISVTSDLEEWFESKMNLDDDEDEESSEKICQSN